MISEIEIRLRADIARLQQDMDNARRTVGTGLDRINAAVGKTVGLLGGLAVGAGAVSFARFIKGSIDAADALNDLSDRTGVAIEDLAGLDYAARLSGTSLEGVAGAVNKLSMNIGKDTAKFRELGVTATEPVEALKQLADIFKTIQDPQQRAAFGAAALGKSWAEAAPLLAQGADGIDELMNRGKQLSGVTAEVARDAGLFNDKLDELGFAVQGVGTRLSADLLPLLNELVSDLNATGKAAEDAGDDFKPLTEIMRALVILGGNVAFTFKAVGSEIGTLAAQMQAVGSAQLDFIGGDFKGAVAELRRAFGDGGIGDLAKQDADKARAAFDAWEQRILSAGKAAKKAQEEADIEGFMLGVDNAIAAGSKAAQVAAFTNAEEVAAARKKAADEAQKAAEKEANAYRDTISAIREKIAADEAEMAAAAPLLEAQKMRIKLDQDLRSGKLVLTKAHEAEIRAALDSLEAHEKYGKAVKNTTEALAALRAERDSDFQAAVKEAEKAEEAVRNFGLSAQAIEKLTLARMEDRLAQRSALDLGEEEVEQLEKLIKIRKRVIAAGGQLDVLEKQKKATDEATKAQKDMWESIDKTAHDTFVSILDGNKDFATRMKESLKNIFFDWLYQMTIKKWILNIQTNATSGGGSLADIIGGLAGGSSGGGGSGMGGIANWISIGKTIYQGFSTGAASSLGSMVANFGQLFGSEAIQAFGAGMVGGSAGAGTASAASGFGGTSAAGAGASFAKAIPIIGWIIAGMQAASGFMKQGFEPGRDLNFLGKAIGKPTNFEYTSLQKLGLSKSLANILSGASITTKLFGRAAPRIESQGIQGTLSASGFTGEAFANILEKGGLFRSSKRYTRTAAISGEQDKFFDDAIMGLLGSAQGFAAAMGLETRAIEGYSRTIKLTLTNDEAANQKLISAVFGQIADDLAYRLVPNLQELAVQGETAAATLQRLGQNYVNLDAILSTIGTTFGAVGLGSLAARERLINLAGGLDQLATNVSGFAQNFLTEAERIAPVAEAVKKSLADMNLSWVDTREEFKQVVLATDKTTEAGAKQFTALMALQEAFAAVYPATQDATAALEQRAALEKELREINMTQAERERAAIYESNLALYDAIQARKAEKQAIEDNAKAQAEAVKLMREKLSDAVTQSLVHLDNAVAAQRDANKAALEEVIGAVGAQVDKANSKIADLQKLSSALSSFTPAGQTAALQGASSQVARAQITTALAIARASGVLPSADSLQFALSALQRDDGSQFATSEEYQRSQLRAANDINALSKLTAGQVTVEQKTLEVLEQQREQAEAAYATQNKTLDNLLATAKEQAQAALENRDVLAAIPPALLTIPGALQGLQVSIAALANMSGPRPQIEPGTPEYTAAVLVSAATAYAQQVQQGTMPQGTAELLAELQILNAKIAAMQASMAQTAANTSASATSGQQLAQQFDQVTAGGNALLTQAA